MKYLDLTGLGEVWANIKSYISSKIPTKTSQLQNDSSYATTSQLPSKTSQLTNDSDFTTNAKLATKQDTINDLATIRSGASKGATAVQPSTLNNYYTKTEVETELASKANSNDAVLKTNIDYIFRDYSLNSLNIDEKYNENYTSSISEDGYGTRPVGGWTQIINFNATHFIMQLCSYNGSSDLYVRSRYASSDRTWSNWEKLANDSEVVKLSGNETINGDKTFNKLIQTNSGLWTKDNICLRIQNIDNNETNPTQEIGTSAIGFTNKDASAWWAYNRYIRTTADGTAYLNLLCHPIKKSDGSYTTGGYINIYNTGFARVNDPLKIDPNATWNNNNIVTSNWVRKYFSNSIGNYWSKSATGTQYSRSTFSYLSPIDKATTNTSWSQYRPFRIVDKDNSIELGYVEYGYKSDLAYTRLTTHHNNGGWLDFTIHSNGVAYLDNCKELWLVNKNLNSYNTSPSNEVDTQLWFMDKNSNKYATLQTDYFPNGIRQFALTHKSLRTNTWIGLNIKTSPTDDVIQCQPRFQAIDSIVVHSGTELHNFTNIYEGWIEMSATNYCYIDFKHETSQDYLGRIGLNPSNILHLETINGAPIMANGKNIVRSVNGVNADNNGNVNIQNLSLPIGSYIQFAGSQAPSGFLVCNGGAISRTTYANLFAVIGTTYGSGDGSTTFNLPNLTDRFLQGSTRIGTVKYAGLPNIMGTINIGTVDNAPESYSNGALSMVSVGDQGYQRAGGVRTLRSISFDASNYNHAYGNASTIQPPALTCLICIKY